MQLTDAVRYTSSATNQFNPWATISGIKPPDIMKPPPDRDPTQCAHMKRLFEDAFPYQARVAAATIVGKFVVARGGRGFDAGDPSVDVPDQVHAAYKYLAAAHERERLMRRRGYIPKKDKDGNVVDFTGGDEEDEFPDTDDEEMASHQDALESSVDSDEENNGRAQEQNEDAMDVEPTAVEQLAKPMTNKERVQQQINLRNAALNKQHNHSSKFFVPSNRSLPPVQLAQAAAARGTASAMLYKLFKDQLNRSGGVGTSILRVGGPKALTLEPPVAISVYDPTKPSTATISGRFRPNMATVGSNRYQLVERWLHAPQFPNDNPLPPQGMLWQCINNRWTGSGIILSERTRLRIDVPGQSGGTVVLPCLYEKPTGWIDPVVRRDRRSVAIDENKARGTVKQIWLPTGIIALTRGAIIATYHRKVDDHALDLASPLAVKFNALFGSVAGINRPFLDLVHGGRMARSAVRKTDLADYNDVVLENDRRFCMENKLLQILDMTGSHHFKRLYGPPMNASTVVVTEKIPDRSVADNPPRSLLGLWRLAQCLFKIVCVLNFGSEDLYWPIRGWTPIVLLDVDATKILVHEDNDHFHSCGLHRCYKICATDLWFECSTTSATLNDCRQGSTTSDGSCELPSKAEVHRLAELGRAEWRYPQQRAVAGKVPCAAYSPCMNFYWFAKVIHDTMVQNHDLAKLFDDVKDMDNGDRVLWESEHWSERNAPKVGAYRLLNLVDVLLTPGGAAGAQFEYIANQIRLGMLESDSRSVDNALVGGREDWEKELWEQRKNAIVKARRQALQNPVKETPDPSDNEESEVDDPHTQRTGRIAPPRKAPSPVVTSRASSAVPRTARSRSPRVSVKRESSTSKRSPSAKSRTQSPRKSSPSLRKSASPSPKKRMPATEKPSPASTRCSARRSASPAWDFGLNDQPLNADGDDDIAMPSNVPEQFEPEELGIGLAISTSETVLTANLTKTGASTKRALRPRSKTPEPAAVAVPVTPQKPTPRRRSASPAVFRTTSSRATPTRATPVKVPSGKATAIKVTPIRVTPAKATPIKATIVKATLVKTPPIRKSSSHASNQKTPNVLETGLKIPPSGKANAKSVLGPSIKGGIRKTSSPSRSPSKVKISPLKRVVSRPSSADLNVLPAPPKGVLDAMETEKMEPEDIDVDMDRASDEDFQLVDEMDSEEEIERRQQEEREKKEVEKQLRQAEKERREREKRERDLKKNQERQEREQQKEKERLERERKKAIERLEKERKETEREVEKELKRRQREREKLEKERLNEEKKEKERLEKEKQREADRLAKEEIKAAAAAEAAMKKSRAAELERIQAVSIVEKSTTSPAKRASSRATASPIPRTSRATTPAAASHRDRTVASPSPRKKQPSKKQAESLAEAAFALIEHDRNRWRQYFMEVHGGAPCPGQTYEQWWQLIQGAEVWWVTNHFLAAWDKLKPEWDAEIKAGLREDYPPAMRKKDLAEHKYHLQRQKAEQAARAAIRRNHETNATSEYIIPNNGPVSRNITHHRSRSSGGALPTLKARPTISARRSLSVGPRGNLESSSVKSGRVRARTASPPPAVAQPCRPASASSMRSLCPYLSGSSDVDVEMSDVTAPPATTTRSPSVMRPLPTAAGATIATAVSKHGINVGVDMNKAGAVATALRKQRLATAAPPKTRGTSARGSSMLKSPPATTSNSSISGKRDKVLKPAPAGVRKSGRASKLCTARASVTKDTDTITGEGSTPS